MFEAPVFISLFSPEFKMMLLGDVFGNNPSDDAIMMFDQFALVLGLVIIGIIALIYGSLSFNDINVLRRLSLLYFALAGFFALPDLISAFKGEPTAPLPVIADPTPAAQIHARPMRLRSAQSCRAYPNLCAQRCCALLRMHCFRGQGRRG